MISSQLKFGTWNGVPTSAFRNVRHKLTRTTLSASIRHGLNGFPSDFAFTGPRCAPVIVGYLTDNCFPSEPYCGDRRVSCRLENYLEGERFDPETTRLLGIAFEFAIQALHNWGIARPTARGNGDSHHRFCESRRAGPRAAVRSCCGGVLQTDNHRPPSPLPPHASPPGLTENTVSPRSRAIPADHPQG